MTEETKKKEEIETKPVNEQVILSDGDGKNGMKSQVLKISKGLKYVILEKNIKKELRYELVDLLPKQRKKKADAWETKKRKKIWLTTYLNHVGNSYETICEKTGIPRRTFDNWKINDPKFRDAIFEKKENRVEVWEDRMVSEGMKGNVSALKFLLESNSPTYNRRLKVETYTGDRTLEDLLDEDEEELNKENNDDSTTEEKKNKEGSETSTGEAVEDKKQEGEDRPVSA